MGIDTIFYVPRHIHLRRGHDALSSLVPICRTAAVAAAAIHLRDCSLTLCAGYADSSARAPVFVVDISLLHADGVDNRGARRAFPLPGWLRMVDSASHCRGVWGGAFLLAPAAELLPGGADVLLLTPIILKGKMSGRTSLNKCSCGKGKHAGTWARSGDEPLHAAWWTVSNVLKGPLPTCF